MNFDCELFVIGGGSGCVRAARVAAQTGAKVGRAEEYRYGGTYVVRGCVPKKLMVFASEFSGAVGDAAEYGWQVVRRGFDWRATLAGPNTVELGDGTQKTAKYILIATGDPPLLPGVKGDHIGLSSNDVFHLDELPKSILILRGFDDEARGLVSEEMCQRGVELHLGKSDLVTQPQNGGIQVLVSNGQNRVFDKVMFATGRTPDSDSLGLEKTEVETGRNGEIIADRFSQTSVPSIYAIGDVTDRVNLTPVAVREGMAFFETVFCNNPTSPDHELIPTAIFTQPEIGNRRIVRRGRPRAGGNRSLCDIFPIHTVFRCRSDRAGSDETGGQPAVAQGAWLLHRRIGRRRDDPACRNRHQNGRDEGRFRQGCRCSPHSVGRAGHEEGTSVLGMEWKRRGRTTIAGSAF